MINSQELNSYIVKKGLTHKKTAELIGISPRAFSDKFTGKTFFNSKEIEDLISILDITDVKGVFFYSTSSAVRNTECNTECNTNINFCMTAS